ncbi:pyrophosphatase [Aureococcus anophagefferens]|nr:pyrophosphatase [Aureococcus anophagefferens]
MAELVAQPPDHFACPLTFELMVDPVVDPTSGTTYEKAAIVEWLTKNATSPVSGAALRPSQLVPNLALRNAIDEWREAHGVPAPPRSPTPRRGAAHPPRRPSAAASAPVWEFEDGPSGSGAWRRFDADGAAQAVRAAASSSAAAPAPTVDTGAMTQTNVGRALAQIAPRTEQIRHLRDQLAEQTLMREQCVKMGVKDKSVLSMIAVSADKTRKALASAEQRLVAAEAHVDEVTCMTATSIASRLVADRHGYQAALDRLDAAEPGMDREREEEYDEHHFAHKAKILAKTARGFNVVMHNKEQTANTEYREGFGKDAGVKHYEHDLPPERVVCHDSGHVLQAISAYQKDRQSVDHLAPEFLVRLYADAERTLPLLSALADDVKAKVGTVKVFVAPLKTYGRAIQKALEKYRGDFRRLTDLCRMTVECGALSDVERVLGALSGRADFKVAFVKDRLARHYDASSLGGYRDMLINLRCATTGHVCELQISVADLLALKHGGGHATTNWRGRWASSMTTPTTTSGAGAARARRVVSLFKTYAGPKTTLAASASFFTRCPNLVDFRVQNANLAGPVPPEMGRCAKLTNLQIWGNQFSGPLPRELANCALLASLGGVENGRMKGIVGPCPAEILAMPRLTQAERDGLARLS